MAVQKKSDIKTKSKNTKIVVLVVALILVVIGGILFMGAVSGWFGSQKVILSPEYYQKETNFMDLNVEEYEKLAQEKKSFVVFVDQDGCTTADRLRNYIKEYMEEIGIVTYRMMFNEMKKTSLHELVKYYPSVVLIDKGKIKVYLRADSNDDAEAYNDYNAFKKWIDQYLQVVEK